MRLLATVFFAIATFLVSVPAEAAPDGAFGKTLGDVFKTPKYPARQADDGQPLYAFKPKHPYEGLSNYYVLTTPVTRRIYEIWATGAFPSLPSCHRELETVHKILILRHSRNGGVTPMPDGGVRIVVMPRMTILAFCEADDRGRATLFLQYRDNLLGEEAKSEAADKRAKGADIEGM